MKFVKVLKLNNGEQPFQKWIDSLEKKSRAKIYAYIDRIAAGGGKKNIKSLKEGVFEIKINYGPGYRVYFGMDGEKIILLLIGGDKGRQSKDVETAKNYWRQYVSK
ncbi:MAG: type II toxin-antitoxin system RelE/ParE family toxin [Bacteriovoracaceae bacterium]|nr:type II toxin-antitoxin system RelE/ParE family toxin [Bacteriovoracaceae bacterium]